jgi:hypothetical protein
MTIQPSLKFNNQLGIPRTPNKYTPYKKSRINIENMDLVSL